ncbi:MAG TPA: sulfocyanin-like copper-binding protein, partial [Acidimicrobiales bacterium]|nr:sulfocyanin-like copper-binding protein [Acidimicrobiales bacterium]
NHGALTHEFVAFGTKLADDRLPLKDGDVDENGAGVTHFDPEAENIRPGTSKTITLHLPVGQYVLICNLPGHYKAGMHTELTVS